jgi:hypothetical protein
MHVERLQRALEDGLRQLPARYVQIALRELQTLAGHPDRVHVWTRLAKETAVATRGCSAARARVPISRRV